MLYYSILFAQELPPQSRAADKIVEYVEWALGPAMALTIN